MGTPARAVAAAVVAATTMLASSSGAQAQTPSASPRSVSPNQASPSIANAPPLSDQKLDAAAAAISRVAFLRQNYERQIAQADPAERPKLIQQANGALTQAVKDQGLSVDEYNSIIGRAQQDPGVRQKLLDRLHPQNGGGGAPPAGGPSGGPPPSHQ